jgi:putative ABC transport system permease protein
MTTPPPPQPGPSAPSSSDSPFLSGVWRDVRFALRTMRLSPGFTLVILVSLALGIGANTAIFQLMDAVLLRSLPVQSPRELAEVHIFHRRWGSGDFNGRHSELTYALWQQIRDHQQAFSHVFAFGNEIFNLANGGQVQRADGLWLSGDAFATLGVRPLLGRVLTVADDQPGCGSSAVVVSYQFWQRQYAGDPRIIGRSLSLDGHPFEIVGVTPASFTGLDVGHTYDVAVPICAVATLMPDDKRLERRWFWWLDVIGRLQPGWTMKRAAAYLQAASGPWFEATIPTDFYDAHDSKRYTEYRLSAFPGTTGVSELRDDYSSSLWLLIAITGAVLLIACANLANLFLARAGAREREIAVRQALGASRRRIVRQLLSESLLLACLGALAGLVLAFGLSRYLVRFISTPDDLLSLNLGMDWRVFGFTAGLALLTCLLFGLVPAIRATRVSPAAAMKAGSRGMTMSRDRHGLRRSLVVSQIALSLVLLVAALLFIRSLRYLLTLDAGFRQNGILVAHVDFSQLKIPEQGRIAFRQDVLDRVRAAPGVADAGDTQIVPISGSGWNQWVLSNGKRAHDIPWMNRISPGFFKTMGTPLLAGRDFNRRDNLASPPVAIVNQLFARKILDAQNPIGKTFQIVMPPGAPRPFYEVVGLVKDTKYNDMRGDFHPIAYFPLAQDQHPAPEANLMIRSDLPLSAVIASLKRTFADVSPDAGFEFRAFNAQIRDSLLRERLIAMLAGFFGFLAALLATVGLYGVISYMVARRTGEIGVRMALGAERFTIFRLIMGEAGTLLAVGIVAGAAIALAAGRAAASMMFGLKAYDPLTFVLAAGLLILVSLAATFIPARRAAALDPMLALREE